MDQYTLQRFVDAQDAVFPQVLDELGRGHKTSHWMWFVFPQLRARGRSANARFFGIGSRSEALAYWRHALLAPRLRQCTGLMLAPHGRSAVQVLGPIDALKFRSSMTLFNAVAPDERCFGEALDRFFGGQPDAATLALL
jgi:uncharacterized protein (DUF1810 family)